MGQELKELVVWYDKDGDLLEIVLEAKEGVFHETEHEEVMVTLDAQGNALAFLIQGLSAFNLKDLRLSLDKRQPEATFEEERDALVPEASLATK